MQVVNAFLQHKLNEAEHELSVLGAAQDPASAAKRAPLQSRAVLLRELVSDNQRRPMVLMQLRETLSAAADGSLLVRAPLATAVAKSLLRELDDFLRRV